MKRPSPPCAAAPRELASGLHGRRSQVSDLLSQGREREALEGSSSWGSLVLGQRWDSLYPIHSIPSIKLDATVMLLILVFAYLTARKLDFFPCESRRVG